LNKKEPQKSSEIDKSTYDGAFFYLTGTKKIGILEKI
jgi:hypothetical protein